VTFLSAEAMTSLAPGSATSARHERVRAAINGDGRSAARNATQRYINRTSEASHPVAVESRDASA
jgi:hypothetical protein